MTTFGQIEFPLAEMFVQMKSGNTPKSIENVIEKIKSNALERARANAPIRTGKFRKSLFVDAKMEGNSLVVDFGSSMSEEAIFLHEGEYALGPISRDQPGTKEGNVGKKFFTRVIETWANQWAEWIEEAIFNELKDTA